MIADGRHAVADLIHDVDDVFAGGDGADCVALDGVAAVDHDHVIAGFLVRLFIGDKTRIADVIVDSAVNVVGVQDGDRLVRGRLLGKCEAAHQQRNRHQNGENLANHLG